MKQAIIVRSDLKLPKGKLAVQVAHASLDAVLKTDRRKIEKWMKEGAKKVVLKVKDEKELIKRIDMAKSDSLTTTLIYDAGLTVVPPHTLTCGAVGPDEDKKIDKIIKDLKLL